MLKEIIEKAKKRKQKQIMRREINRLLNLCKQEDINNLIFNEFDDE